MLRRNWIFRDRTYPFNADVRWWIHFQEIQIKMKRNSDHSHNRRHWMGHCDQQSYRFLKLTSLLHVSLVIRRSSPVVVVFKMCVASWSGWVRTALFRDLLNGFSRSKNRNKWLAISEQTDESCMPTERQTYPPFSKSGLGAIRLELYLLFIHTFPELVGSVFVWNL